MSEGRESHGAVIAQDRTCFLSPEWVREVTRVVQSARKTDENFRKLADDFSLKLLYRVSNLPPEVSEHYGGGTQAVIFVQLEKGTVRKIQIGTQAPEETADFTVASDYTVVRKIFQGELNAATSFINREFQVEPVATFYARPKFVAKSIVTGNRILKIARQVPTVFAPGF
ncbi:MAG: hypothetical protein HY647_07010 [Acidobacteria bacterium]|nr:hypothetical protein [Acidobacteriota bacterium]